jgi:alkanesulfonate monooxygenase SsuD/methylene tetrahydromethanopterin reductase-like flavin-dependent oxidoreductase (luciferase family)
VTAEVVAPSRGLAVDVFLVGGRPGPGNATQALRGLVDNALAAEAAGFDGVWIAEHHFIEYGSCPSALTLAGHLLGRTRRLKVGTAATILSTRHPVAVAEEAAMLDAVSGGRLLPGVARGGPWVDLEVFGTGLRRYREAFPDALDILQRCLSGRGQVAADGEHFQFRPVSLVPTPSRPIPVWVAATSPDTVRAAASRGMSLLLGMHQSATANREMIDLHGEVATAHQHDPDAAEHATAHLAHVADTDAQARADIIEPLTRWLATTRQYVRIDGSAGPERDPHDYARQLIDLHAVGSAGRCIRRLAEAAAVSGCRRLMLAVEVCGHAGRTMDNIRRLGAEVLPHVRPGMVP